MASNGLVANLAKAVLMLFNSINHSNALGKMTIRNSEVPESTNAKLLGMVIGNDQKWKEHILVKEDWFQH